MNEPEIKRTSFDRELEKVKEFSNNLPENPCFDLVEVNGTVLGFTGHNVTGAEMNNFIGKVQERMIFINTTLHTIIKEFAQVYQVFDTLDKEYVAGILGSLAQAHKASRTAQIASEENAHTLESLQKTVTKLVQLYAEFTEYKKISLARLTDLEKHIPALNKAIEDIYQLQSFHNSFRSQSEEIEIFVQYLEESNIFENMSHLQYDVEGHRERIKALDQKIEETKVYHEATLKTQNDELMNQLSLITIQQHHKLKVYRLGLIVAYVLSVISSLISLYLLIR